jgi:hypothetical protein
MFVLIEISQGVKNFLIYLKTLLEKKPFQTFYYSLKDSFEKIRFQNTILYPMQAYLQRKYLQNVLH